MPLSDDIPGLHKPSIANCYVVSSRFCMVKPNLLLAEKLELYDAGGVK